MRKNHFFFYCLIIVVLLSCKSEVTLENVAEEYCACIQLQKSNKEDCVLQWNNTYKGVAKDKESQKALMYSMIECNGFEGEIHYGQYVEE